MADKTAPTVERFNKDSFEVGGTITIPASMVCKGEGKIVGVYSGSIGVEYTIKGEKHYTMYSYQMLNHHYGKVSA